MAKQTPQQPPAAERVRAKMFRILPHLDSDGRPVPGKWDMDEVVVSGVIESRKVHETAATLGVARHRHTIEVTRWMSREAPETWK